MLYTNGGRSWKHARTVTEKGNQHINDYINHGGSYVGTCAGAFLASKAVVSTGKPTYVGLYYSIWPGYTCHTGLSNSSTTVSLEKKSPLLKYADFGKDMQEWQIMEQTARELKNLALELDIVIIMV